MRRTISAVLLIGALSAAPASSAFAQPQTGEVEEAAETVADESEGFDEWGLFGLFGLLGLLGLKRRDNRDRVVVRNEPTLRS